MKVSKEIIFFILIVINIFVFYKLNNNHFNIKNTFKLNCEINNIEDVEMCYKTNPNVVINVNDVYESGYNYIDDKYVYVDIDISGKTLIGLIKKEDLNNKKIYGYLSSKVDIITKEIIEQIKDDYINKMEVDNIEELFIPLTLNSYNYKNNNINNLIYISLFIATLIGIIYIGFRLIDEKNTNSFRIFK